MYHTDIEPAIPSHALAPDVITGSKMFSIHKANCSVMYKRADFLVPHRKGYYFWAFVKDGANKHWIDTKPYVLKSNTFYFTVPHQVHLKEDGKPFTGIILGFTEEFLALEENSLLRQLPIIQNPENGHELLLSDADVAFIGEMLEKVYTENSNNSNWQHSMLMSYMRVLMIYLSRLYVEQFSNVNTAPGRVLLKRYLNKIEENYARYHEVSAYADMLNISAGHLSEVVKEQSGKPAIAHIHDRLILETKRLLFHSDHSVKEIAFRLGFEDASYFNRFFKRIVNDTPVAYRTAIREMYR
ncbi:helix-turn-helix domain-containing protein [Mucilaginibacter sp. UR6-11]|uniref:helix-turn-helix domain-containing protein n=1 Tax=Mucilaginibacter sp. UR6-11 TaxID=1435644 RepID=UPI001E4ECC0E|nr:helix-turn-helix domain-containing protein [Mucilaginibacter sp. UR6-11]MCC8423417.1 helix-turn-helix domain-containing protein [Mucilaginibacter sp. UR6-11]